MVEQWMIYGATGYTGRLVAERAVASGQRPVLAGRNPAAVAALADRLGLSYRVAELTDPAGLRTMLAGMAAVAHCAGPFSRTAAPMVDACLATGTHYLDITGELTVFSEVFARHRAAADAGIILLPGAGFDVVPTDCLAATLASALPTADRLELAFLAGGGMSRGTARTGVTMLGDGARRRIGGDLRPTRVGTPEREVPFPSGSRRVGAVSWGDLVTGYRSTGIGDITVYTRVPATGWWGRAAAVVLGRLMRYAVMRRLAERVVNRRPAGPSASTRAATRCEVWGEVRDPAGITCSATLVGPNAYDLTADAVVRAAGYLAAGTGPGGSITPGAHTPSSALGADFVRELTGVALTPPTPVPPR